MDKTRVFQIVNTETGKVVRQIEVTGMEGREVDKFFSGLCRRVDFNRFHINDTADREADDMVGRPPEQEVTRE